VALKRATNVYDTGKIYTAKSIWEAKIGRSSLHFEHHEIWRAADDPIDSFPGDESFSPDRKGGVMLVYSREEETIHRNKENAKCAFTDNYPLLSAEHCSAVQALAAAQLITVCRGD
jgi:hypothetical protein